MMRGRRGCGDGDRCKVKSKKKEGYGNGDARIELSIELNVTHKAGGGLAGVAGEDPGAAALWDKGGQ